MSIPVPSFQSPPQLQQLTITILLKHAGDMIPWTISQQFNDNEFATLSGARIVRIATHPDVQKMGYGSRAIDLLISYFQGEFNDGMAQLHSFRTFSAKL